MKASTSEEQDHKNKAEIHDYKVGQQIWLDDCNFLNKNKKLAPNWFGPF